jgi:hypothetical protein
MPRIIYLRRLKKFEVVSGLRTTRFNQGNATDAARQTHRYGHTDRPRPDDCDLNLCRTTFG